jgi:hypothetical protein
MSYSTLSKQGGSPKMRPHQTPTVLTNAVLTNTVLTNAGPGTVGDDRLRHLAPW